MRFLGQGTAIWMALIAVFKDPKNYPDPEVFRPERFDQESEETKNRSPYAFFPFGIGPRTCIGYKFATMEIKMLLIQIYRRFIIHRSPLMEETLELEFGMIVRPAKDILVRVHRRHLQSSQVFHHKFGQLAHDYVVHFHLHALRCNKSSEAGINMKQSFILCQCLSHLFIVVFCLLINGFFQWIWSDVVLIQLLKGDLMFINFGEKKPLSSLRIYILDEN